MPSIAGTRSPVRRLHQPPRTYLSCTSEHANTHIFPILGYILPVSHSYLMVDVAANSGFLFEMEARHVRNQLYEFDCTAVDLTMSTEMSYCRAVEVFCKEFCVDPLEVSVARSIVMERSGDIKELLTLK
jgi:hypothetical protein